jgi:signal transduction histidine kinase
LQSSFFNNVSHEFRTPLTLILGALETLTGHKEVEQMPAVQATLKLLRVNSNRLLQMVNNLLEFSTFEVKYEKR